MLKFCFPERDTDESDLSDESDKKGHTHSRGKETSFYVPIERKDDVEKMKVSFLHCRCVTLFMFFIFLSVKFSRYTF